MKAREALAELLPHSRDAVVVTALGMAAHEWWPTSRSEESFYLHGAMGYASGVALGLALALPQANIWCLDTDGSLCMVLGALLTEAGAAAPNLKHLVLNNGIYQTVGSGGYPMVNGGRQSYAELARAAGLPRVWRAASLQEWRACLPEAVLAPGPAFVELVVEGEERPVKAPPEPFEGPETKYRFGRSNERRFGVTVFGPGGF